MIFNLLLFFPVFFEELAIAVFAYLRENASPFYCIACSYFTIASEDAEIRKEK